MNVTTNRSIYIWKVYKYSGVLPDALSILLMMLSCAGICKVS